MKTGIIYSATGPTGRVYIGKTIQSLHRRKVSHKSKSGNRKDPNFDCHFYRAIRKYGVDEFVWTVIEDNINLNILSYKEQYYIRKLNTYKNGYNSTLGGEGTAGRIVSEQERKNISKRQMGKNNSFYGKKHSEEVRKMLKEKGKRQAGKRHPCYGKSLSDEHKRKISNSLIGSKNPFYGKKHKTETRLKISEMAKNRIMSEETKNKISNTLKTKCIGDKNPFYGKAHTKKQRGRFLNILLENQNQKIKRKRFLNLTKQPNVTNLEKMQSHLLL